VKLSISLIAAALVLGPGYAAGETTTSDQGNAALERKASPANDTKQDEEQAEAHGQPDSNSSSGRSDAQGTARSPESVSAGSSAAPASGDAKAKPEKPTAGNYYQSNENKADSTKNPPDSGH
jgi:hypothetical protein